MAVLTNFAKESVNKNYSTKKTFRNRYKNYFYKLFFKINININLMADFTLEK